ncbi:cytochrome C biogenesis transmembrane region family protein [Mycobacterium xenopi 3993]|nr:cytochrome C biogenesis transmembrane region family protein [Mycobacterium xenopi 3993]
MHGSPVCRTAVHAVAAQPIRRFAHPSVADAAANNGYVHPRADRLRRRPDHWYFTVHPPGLAGDLFRRRATRPGDSAQAADSGGAVVVAAKRSLSETLRPYLVIGGLVLSFSLVTLLGSALLSLLHLPQDAIRWVALAALVAIGLGLIFPGSNSCWSARSPAYPRCGSPPPQRLRAGSGARRAVCAVRGPGAGRDRRRRATASIGVGVVVLTVAFAVGTAVPLLFFALAGQRVAERVSAFRRRQREIRVAAGIVTILLAVALVLNLPAVLQRAIPDYTNSLQEKVGGGEQIRQKLNLGGIVTDQNRQLSNCSNGPRSWKTAARHPISKASPHG